LQTTGAIDVGAEVGRDFARARRRAIFGRLSRALAARLRGDGPAAVVTDRLDCFGEARGALGEALRVRRGLRTVELTKTSGSVGRCLNFDGAFLPACACTRDRWEGVDRALREGKWLPPVELYKLGETYFVADGNHRVSVARYRGFVAVDAVVTELLDFKTSEKPVDSPELIRSYERQLATYAHILERRHGKRPERLFLYWTAEPNKEDALMELPYRPETVDEAAERPHWSTGVSTTRLFSARSGRPSLLTHKSYLLLGRSLHLLPGVEQRDGAVLRPDVEQVGVVAARRDT